MIIKITYLLSTTLFLLLIGSLYSSQAQTKKPWQKVTLPLFSFSVPSDFSQKEIKGDDSAIWKYYNEDSELTVDLGIYSGKPEIDSDELEYLEKKVIINGKKATIVSFRNSEPNSNEFEYLTAVYFPKVDSSGTKLSFVISSKTKKYQAVARQIFNSIKFK